MNTNIALRLSFQVPEFSDTGKLSGYHLEHVVRHSIVDAAVFTSLFDNDIEKLIEAIKGKADGAKRVATKLGLTDRQARLIRYTGVSIARHDPTSSEKIPANDARWT